MIAAVDVSNDFRRWLRSLNDVDLGAVLMLSGPLRAVAKLPHGIGGMRAPVRRELLAARAWLAKTQAHQLVPIAEAVLSPAADLLVHHLSFNEAMVADPTREHLGEMLVALGRPIGKVVLYGLLLGDVQATPTATRYRAELEGVVRGASRKSLPDLILSGDHDVTDRIGAGDTSGRLVELDQRLTEFQNFAAETSASLRRLADDVERGAVALLTAPFSQYSERREQLLRELDLPEDAAFADAEAYLENLRQLDAERQREEQSVAARVNELSEQIRGLETILGTLPEEAKSGLMDSLAVLRKEYATLTSSGASDVESVTEPEPQLEADVDPRPEPDPPSEPQGPLQANETPELPPMADVVLESGPSALEHEEVPQQDEFLHGWDEGDPPLAVDLTRAGRLGEAYWVTAMSGEFDRRVAALRFAAAAYAVTSNAEATAVLAALDLDAQELSVDTEAAVVVTTAVLRAGLVAGWGHPLLAQLGPELTLPAPWQTLVDTCITAVRREFRVDFEVGLVPPEEDVHEARAELGRQAAVLMEELPRRKNNYQRATRVLQRLMVTGQPLSNALEAVRAWSENASNGQAVSDVAAEFAVPGAIDSMIKAADAAMRTPKQSRVPIVATALRTLRRSLEEVGAIVQEADAVHRRLTAAESDDAALGQKLLRAAADAGSAEVPPGMVGAAVSLLHRWLETTTSPVWTGFGPGDSPLSSEAPDIAEPSADVLLPLPDLPRDAQGRPDQDDPRTSAVLARLSEPLDLDAAVRSYGEVGDLRSALRVIELAETGFWAGNQLAASAREKVAAARESLARKHRADLMKARELFARVRTQNLLDQVEESTVSGRLLTLGDVPDGRFDEAARRVSDLVSGLEAKQRSWVEELRAELAALTLSDQDRQRVAGLLDDDDTVTAAEFLAFVREGKPLPEYAELTGQDLKEFTGVLADGAARGLTAPQTGATHWAKLIVKDGELAELGAVGVKAWDSLTDNRQHSGDQLPVVVKDILRTLGLNSSTRPREYNQRQRLGFRKFRVQAVPSDGSYVSVLGSAASEYNVIVVTDERRGRTVIDVLGPEESGRANVVLYLHPMDLGARRQLAAHAVGTSAQALVVDPAVFSWVAAKAPGSWRATQRVTLPWTALNPYTPFVAGLVPPEVFVGRAKEIAEVIDPRGGLFIYGGRQLGKSALLRRVEATFNSVDDQHAVYLDLKGRGIGEAEPAGRIWRELVLLLKERGVLQSKVAADVSADDVVTQIRTWLNNKPGKRLLLLADEADAFLTADSRGVPTAGGVATFPNVLRLKELMESTERRFKVVFAGLHQVQRFGHLSNVPLAHGGPDILVGPLDAADARKLVAEPLAALGYTFEQPELVWRLLAATNYQASLIQIFCEELVRTLHSRVSQIQDLPMRIRESDVEAVAASDRVRARIAERLRITINLEDRYRVLMLIIALESLKDSFGADYGADELLELARLYWPAGFDDMTVTQTSIHLTEMVGLGLLIRLSGQDRFAVRSPNVVNMLGTKSDLERELEETDFDLPYEYNPRDARRLLQVDGNEVDRRSPFTDGQLSDLTGSTSGLSVVVGSAALGVDRVAEAVSDYAKVRSLNVDICKMGTDVTRALQAASRRRRPTVVVADLRGKSPAEIRRAEQLLTESSVAAVLVLERDEAEKLGAEPVRLARWTVGSLRSWPECPFDVVEARTKLIEATGGWPELVEDLISTVVRRGRTQAQALDMARRGTDDRDWAARFLEQADVSAGLRDRIGVWVDYFDPGDLASPADVAEALEIDLAHATALLEELAELGVLDEGANGVSLDRVVHRCLTSLRGTP
ncbi:hypothetical protein SK803_23960 [Lentzea sp. BCCO 10_0856]|uniref:AAA+ ATPase domain-containing protein n=1 Tax=Lentzea miocenica TaxID=3095431 RepID=A0ABU4T534_9PSEU|nr:hypothetical protein [Lentzea sp. BCCO 10_0856]MDX8033285.1 hypothetical protein [Lentzea sp. BCCO 10_0856]